MTLTTEQVQAISEGEPVSIVPPEVGKECVLLRKDVFERVQKSAEDDLPSPLAISRLHKEPIMRRVVVLAVMFSLVFGGVGVWSQARAAEGEKGKSSPQPHQITIGPQSPWKEQKHTDGMGRDYYLYLPKTIDKSKTYWLVVGVTGTGGTGQYACGMCDFVRLGDCIVVGPTFPEGYAFLRDNSDKQLLDLAKELGEKYKLHPRMFVMGFSAGAQFVHRFALKHPEAVIGCAAHAAGSWHSEADNHGVTASADAPKLVPFAVTCGENDNRLEPTKQFVEKWLKKKGFLYRAEYIPDTEHQMTDVAMKVTKECYYLSTTGLAEDERQKLQTKVLDSAEKTMRRLSSAMAKKRLATVPDDWAKVRESVRAARKEAGDESIAPGWEGGETFQEELNKRADAYLKEFIDRHQPRSPRSKE